MNRDKVIVGCCICKCTPAKCPPAILGCVGGAIVHALANSFDWNSGCLGQNLKDKRYLSWAMYHNLSYNNLTINRY